MKVDANRIQTPITEQAKHNKPPKIQQPESGDPTKQVKKPVPSAEPAAKQNHAPGAMRLLQEGHFKGVAALRLRINFSDQLSSMEQETIKETAREGIAELTFAMEEQIDGLNSSGLVEEDTLPQLKELSDTFTSEIHNAITDEKLDPQQLTSALQQNFDNFRTSLQNLLLPSEPTATQAAEADEAIPTEAILPAVEEGDDDHSISMSTLETEQPSEQTTASPVDTMEGNQAQTQLNASLDALDAIFGSQLSAIEGRLQGAALPSVPDRPANEGAAFQKFLSIYQEMQSIAEVGSNTDKGISS